jgi:hypothetical protein
MAEKRFWKANGGIAHCTEAVWRAAREAACVAHWWFADGEDDSFRAPDLPHLEKLLSVLPRWDERGRSKTIPGIRLYTSYFRRIRNERTEELGTNPELR